MSEFEYTTTLPHSPQAVYDWHCREGALQRLTPPWQKVDIEARVSGIRQGSRVFLRLGSGPLRVSWVAEHTRVDPGKGFTDVQISGPFKAWEHRHSFEPDGQGGCLLRDRIDYRLPFGGVGRALGARYVQESLSRVFRFRHRRTADDMEFHTRYSAASSLSVAMTGASGLIGSALAALLTTGGHRVIRLVRSPASGQGASVLWDPVRGVLEPSKLEGVDAVVHLAGESIAEGRWTRSKKERILRSRVEGTSSLVRSLGDLENPPKILVSASAIGIYGNRGDELLDEESAPGSGFLADVCQRWERAAGEASGLGMRVVTARTGVVLTPAGGALAKMLPAFRLGGGGRLGSGTQFMSWISIDDAVGGMVHALIRPEIEGAMNLVAPSPVRNEEFTRQLARVLRRPAIFPLPAVVARALFGEMADEALLASTRVSPGRLSATGYEFRDSELGPALERLLGR